MGPRTTRTLHFFFLHSTSSEEEEEDSSEHEDEDEEEEQTLQLELDFFFLSQLQELVEKLESSELELSIRIMSELDDDLDSLESVLNEMLELIWCFEKGEEKKSKKPSLTKYELPKRLEKEHFSSLNFKNVIHEYYRF